MTATIQEIEAAVADAVIEFSEFVDFAREQKEALHNDLHARRRAFGVAVLSEKFGFDLDDSVAGEFGTVPTRIPYTGRIVSAYSVDAEAVTVRVQIDGGGVAGIFLVEGESPNDDTMFHAP